MQGMPKGPAEMLRQDEVPIKRILGAEFLALKKMHYNVTPEWQAEIHDEYEKRVSCLVDAVSSRFGNVNNANEKALFSFMSKNLRGTRASFSGDASLISLAIERNKRNTFNCHSSALIFADALTRTGKELSVITMSDHMVLSGNRYVFETTAPPKRSAFPLKNIDFKYPMRQEFDVRALLSITYNACGVMLFKKRMFKESVEEYDKALDISPTYAAALNNKGAALGNLKNLEDALACLDEALRIDPNCSSIWYNEWLLLNELERYDEADECAVMAAEIKVDKLFGALRT